MKAPVVLHGLGDVSQAPLRRELSSGDFHRVGATFKFFVEPFNGMGGA